MTRRKPTARAPLSARERRDLAEAYTALHEGRPPSGFAWVPPERARQTPAPTRARLRATGLQYRKLVPEGEPSYKHPFAPHAQPRLGVDSRGLPLFYAGRYVTTRRGVEDLPPRLVQAEKPPESSKGRLVGLGRLEWIGYKGVDAAGRARSGRWKFWQQDAPLVAHDEDGALHVLDDPAAGEETTMSMSFDNPAFDNPRRRRSRRRAAAANPRRHGKRRSHRRAAAAAAANPVRRSAITGRFYDTAAANPRHSRRRHSARRSHRRTHDIAALAPFSNPARVTALASGGMAGSEARSRAWKMITGGLVFTSVGVVSALVGAKLLENVTWSTPVKAAAQIGGGIALALVSAYAIPTYPALAAGFLVGGMFPGLMALYNEYVAPRIASMGQPAAEPPAVPATTPAPGGMPYGYQAYAPPGYAGAGY